MNPEIYTFRARSLAEALLAVRQQLGPDAAVLHTRRVGSPLASLLGGPTLELTASAAVDIPSRLPAAAAFESVLGSGSPRGVEQEDFRLRIRQSLRTVGRLEDSLVERLVAADTAAVRRRAVARP
jgi:flagellar biosynthesis GTPase FlhF